MFKFPFVCLLLLEQCYVKIVYISVVQSIVTGPSPVGCVGTVKVTRTHCYTGRNCTCWNAFLHFHLKNRQYLFKKYRIIEMFYELWLMLRCISVSCTLEGWSSAQNFTSVCTQQPSRWIWLCWPNYWMHRMQPHLHRSSLLLGGHLKFRLRTICKERRSYQNRLIRTFQKRYLAASMWSASIP